MKVMARFMAGPRSGINPDRALSGMSDVEQFYLYDMRNRLDELGVHGKAEDSAASG